jgi:hypothetical protein
MATPGALVRVLAGALGVPKATVAQHDRNLLVAGLRSKRGRGWAAPVVTARDVAQLVTAILGSHKVMDSVATVRRYNRTRPKLAELGIDELAALPREHSFVDALEALFIPLQLDPSRRGLQPTRPNSAQTSLEQRLGSSLRRSHLAPAPPFPSETTSCWLVSPTRIHRMKRPGDCRKNVGPRRERGM